MGTEAFHVDYNSSYTSRIMPFDQSIFNIIANYYKHYS
jgi:hypothetical protein